MKKPSRSVKTRAIQAAVLRYAMGSPAPLDQRDVDKLVTNEQFVTKFLASDQTQEQIVSQVINFLTWRQSERINDLQAEDFPLCFYTSGIVTLGHERSRKLIGFVRANKYRKFTELTRPLCTFVVFLLEQMERLSGDNQAGLVVDLSGASLSSVDIQLITSVIPIMANYYPNLFSYVIIVDMPFLLKATAIVAMRAVPEKYRNLIQFQDRKQLHKTFEPDVLPHYLGGSAVTNLECVMPLEPISLKGFAEKYSISQATVNAAYEHFNKLKN